MMFGVDCADVETGRTTGWAGAKANGPLSFAIIRGSYGSTPDVSFATSWPAIKAVGLTRGAYMFLRYPRKGGVTPPDPNDQANAFCNLVGPLDDADLPVTIDVEFPGGLATTGMTQSQALDWLRAAWQTVVARYGVPPILYTSARSWREELGDPAAPDLIESPLWLARYYYPSHNTAVRDPSALGSGHMDPPVPPPWGDAGNWWIHQYQGDAIGLPGFSATVDMDRFNPMFEGGTGDRVKWVERRLGTPETGTFDAGLHAKVVAFQRAHGLAVDGIIGAKTFAALCWTRC